MSKRTKLSRIVSAIMSVVIAVGLVPLPAYAGDAGDGSLGVATSALAESSAATDSADSMQLSTQAALNVANPRVVADSSMSSGQKATWDCVWFGSYPQQVVSDALTVSKLNAAAWQGNRATVDGVTYQRLYKTDTTNSEHFDNFGTSCYGSGSCLYFRCSPVKWRVLETDGSTALLLADQALDCQRYHGSHTSVTWETCDLRSWLNSGFMDAAFTSAQRSAIQRQSLANEDNPGYGTEGGSATQDDVFLLALSDVYGNEASAHGFRSDDLYYDEARCAHVSHFACAMGGSRYTYRGCQPDSGWWWLRSPGSYAHDASTVLAGGDVNGSGNDVDHGDNVVRPALRISLSSNQITYAGTVCSDGTEDVTVGGSSYMQVDISEFQGDELPIGKGSKVQLVCSAATSNIAWNSADSSIVKVDGAGVASGVKVGYAKINAHTADGTHLGSIYVHVVDNEKDSITVFVGESEPLPSALEPLVWSSGDESVAIVEGASVKGVRVGMATLTAISAKGIVYTCEVMVCDRFQGLFGDSSVRNDDLMLLCAKLSNLAYTKGAIAEYLSGSYGCTGFLHYDEDDGDYPGVEFAKASAVIEGTETNIMFVINRGSVLRTSDWVKTNRKAIFEHSGFVPESNEEIARMTSYFKSFVDKSKPTKIVITGHSLGGAMAGLETRAAENLVSRSNVYTYTFACPNYEVLQNESHSNIFNVINVYDVIPYGPTHGRKYGTNLFFERNTGSITESHMMHVYERFIAERPNEIAKTSADLPCKAYEAVFKCPVDVAVLDVNGTMIAETVGDEVRHYESNPSIALQVHGDEKYVYAKIGSGVKYKIIGTGAGVMECGVNMLGSDGGETFENVKIEIGKTFELVNPDDVETLGLMVLDDSGEAVSEVRGDGVEVAHVHDWGESVVVTPATYTTDGERVFTCLRCGSTKTESIPKLGSPDNLTKTSVEDAQLAVSPSSFIYDGEAKTPMVTVTLLGSELSADADYITSYSSNVGTGIATVTVTGQGAYEGEASATFKILKAANPMRASAKVKKVSRSKLKRGPAYVRPIAVKDAQGRVTFAKKFGSKRLSLDKRVLGRVVVKAGTKKGTYKMVVKVRAAGNANYKASVKKAKVTVRVK